MASDSSSSSSSSYNSAADQNPKTPIKSLHDSTSAIDDHLSSLTLTSLNDANSLDIDEESDRTAMPEIGASQVKEKEEEGGVSSSDVAVVQKEVEERESGISSNDVVVVQNEFEERESGISSNDVVVVQNEVEERESGISSNDVVVVQNEVEERGSDLGNGSSGVAWEEVERDGGPGSPSSSGYAGERGSSGASSASGIEEIGDEQVSERNGDFVNGVSDSQANRVPGKRHVNENDASMSWRKRKKHFFILSNSGKPIYSRYGDEHKLAGFSATLQAIISFVENGGDRVKLVRAGKHQVVFLMKGPIYLVCISCTEEPYESLRGQLELLYGQTILILTRSVDRCFEKNSKFDMTPLLGGTDGVFSSLIHSFSWNPATFLHAYTCLPLAYPTRQAAGAILQDVADSGVLIAILMCKHKVVSLGAEKASLHPDDLLLLSNFIMSSESFMTSESFSPICLPKYNPMAFLYAYVKYLDVNTYLLLTTNSDSFFHLKDCRVSIEAVLLKSNVLNEVQKSISDGGMRVEDLPVDPSSRSGSASSHLGQHSPERFRDTYIGVGGGPCGLWHFMYHSLYLDQYVSSEFSSPINTPQQRKRLYRAYQKFYASMHDKGFGPHKTQFRRDENYVLLCWVTTDFELYAAFDPLADKALAIKTCNRVCQWVKDVENEIFLLGASPFAW